MTEPFVFFMILISLLWKFDLNLWFLPLILTTEFHLIIC